MKNKIIDLKKQNFTEIILKKQGIFLVDFWATWCNPCNTMQSILKKFIKNTEISFTIIKINVEEHADLAERYDVRSIPTLILFKNGKLVSSHIGILSEKELKTFFLTHV